MLKLSKEPQSGGPGGWQEPGASGGGQASPHTDPAVPAAAA